MTRSIPASVNPAMLRWTRETAGLDVRTAAGKIKRSADALRSWESGASRPTIAQLRKLARLYKRPMAAFYLPKAPADASAIPDLRRLPSGVRASYSTELRFLIRSARERQHWLRELLRQLGESPVDFVGSALVGEEPVEIARRARTVLGVSVEEQQRWGARDEALRAWTDAMEDAGVFVFQSNAVTVEEMRGFALPDAVAPVIVLNAKDARAARIFSALHEFAHILLDAEGVSNLEPVDSPSGDIDLTEVRCNAVAGEILVPAHRIRAAIASAAGRQDLDTLIEKMSDSFKVSREVIARRLRDLGQMTTDAYLERRERYQKEFGAREEPEQRFWLSPDRRAVRDNGRAFTRLLLTAHNRDLITATDLSRLLGARLKHLSKIEQAAFPSGRGGRAA